MHIYIYYNSSKITFWGVFKKRAVLECFALNANVLHIPAPSPDEGVAYTSLCIVYLQPVEST